MLSFQTFSLPRSLLHTQNLRTSCKDLPYLCQNSILRLWLNRHQQGPRARHHPRRFPFHRHELHHQSSQFLLLLRHPPPWTLKRQILCLPTTQQARKKKRPVRWKPTKQKIVRTERAHQARTRLMTKSKKAQTKTRDSILWTSKAQPLNRPVIGTSNPVTLLIKIWRRMVFQQQRRHPRMTPVQMIWISPLMSLRAMMFPNF
mmetsp:Transcript_5772/g.11425  ORF Transcript_5772/g.11425 Transcript_5772/m.11425 type:complete len:202 (+) Transcript_5772:902-1507(+)